MALIHILDKQTDKIIGTLDKGDYYLAERISNVENENTLEFTALKQFDKLKERNRILLQNREGFFVEYIINFTDQFSRNEKEVTASGSHVDLNKAGVIPPGKWEGQTAHTATETALNGTEWKVGEIEFTNNRTITIAEHTTPLALLKQIAQKFELEIRFRVEIQGNRIIGRYVDMVQERAAFSGKEIEFGKDIVGLRRIENSAHIITALVGIGPEREDGTRLEVLVEDEDALQRWGRNGQHLIEPYFPESDDSEMTLERLRTLTTTELKKRINAIVTYECDTVAIEHVFGHSHEKIKDGQTVRIKDEGYNPPLYLEARIREIKDDPLTEKILKSKIGNFIEFKQEDLEKQVALLKKIMADRLAKFVQLTILSSAGDVFKNGVGQTTLTAKTFLSGSEVDADGSKYSYRWTKRDKNGIPVSGFNKTEKTITVLSDEVDEKNTFVAEVVINNETTTMSEVTVSKVFDGVDGIDGVDGKSVNILGSYATVEELRQAHPTGATGDAYIVAGDLYVWNGTAWENVGQIQGPKGDQGPQGPEGKQGPAGKDGIAHMGTTAPSNPATNATWFQTDTTGKIIAIKKWTGSTWVTSQMDAATLGVKELSAIVANLGEVTAGNITGVTMNLANSKFIVDKDGNIYFGGELNGASGSFSGAVNGGSFTTARGNLDNGDYQIGSFKEGRFEVAKYNSSAVVQTGLAITPDKILQWGFQTTPVEFDGSFKFKNPIEQNPYLPPSFQNFWTNYGGGFRDVGFMKDSLGWVNIQGVIGSGSIGLTRPMFRLPTGMIPTKHLMFDVATNTGPGVVQITPDGDVALTSGGNGWVTLQGIRFYPV